MEAFQRNDYKNAEILFRKTWEEDSLTMSNKDTRRDYSLEWLKHTLYHLGKESEAYDDNPLPEITPLDRRLTVEIDTLYNQANRYFFEVSSANKLLADMKYTSLLREMKREFGEDNPNVGNLYLIISSMYLQDGKADDAYKYACTGTEILSKHETRFKPYLVFIPLAESAKHLVANQYQASVASALMAIEHCKGNMAYIPYQYSMALELLENGCYMEKDSTLLISALDDADKEYFSLPEKKQTNCMDMVLSMLGLRWNFRHTEKMKALLESGYRSCKLYEENGNDAWAARARIMEYEAMLEEHLGNPGRALNLIEEEIDIVASRPGMTPYDYISPLLIQVRLLMSTGQHAKAIEEGLRVDELLISPSTYRDQDRKFNVNMCLGDSYTAMGEPSKALPHYQEAEKIMKKMNDFSPQEIAFVYHSIASAANSSYNTDLFASYLKKVKDTYENNDLDLIDAHYFDACINLGEIAQSKGDKSEPWKTLSALSTLIEDSRRSHTSKQTAFPEGFLKIKQAEHLMREGKKEEALSLAENSVSILENNEEDVPKYFYEIVLNTLPDNIDDIEKVVAISEKMLAAATKDGRKDMEYGDALIYCATANSGVGLIDKAQEYLLQAKEILMSHWENQQSPRFNNIMTRLSTSLCGNHLPEDALEVINFMEENRTKRSWKWICEACWKMNKLQCYVLLQRKDEASSIFSELRNNSVKHDDSDYDAFTTLCRLGNAATSLGRLTEAADCYEEAIAIMPPLEVCTLDQLLMLSSYPTLLNQLGDTKRGNEMFPELLAQLEAKMGSNRNYSAVLLPSLVISTYEKEGMEATRTLLKERIDKVRSETGILSAQTGFAYMFAMEFEGICGSLVTGHDYTLDYYETLRQNPSSINNSHSGFLFRFASGALAKGNYAQAIEALDLIKNNSTIQFDDVTRIKLHSAYGTAYNDNHETNKGYENFLKAFELSRDYILENFLTMTSEERTSFWNTAFSFYRAEIPSAAERGGYTPHYSALAYDATLFSTGLLLASDINVVEAVNESKDRKIRKAYEEFTNQKKMYEKASEVSALRDDEAIKKASVLKDKTKEAEKKLLSLLNKKVGNYNRRLAVGWEDVCKSLGTDEAAVEFLELPVDHYSIYIGLVLRKGYKAPVMKRLFVNDNSSDSPTENPFEDCYNTTALKEKLWQPLADELQGCQTVWFAPQGRLMVTAIESLPGLEEVTGCKGTRFRRVSSTRELVRFDSDKPGSGATLYGDIDFSLDAEGMKRAARTRGINTREAGGGIDELPGTKEEAEFLLKLLHNLKGFEARNTRYLSRGEATETSFKRLSGSSPRILHVGTHGYFATGEDEQEIEKYTRLLSGGVSSEDLAMMRSGLLFAGAEGTLFEDRVLPDDIDDGVLTAREIASLKLQGTELTVLSACETALGEIGADGVFGLQRGLKKAGAGAVMMSLWKVSDEATTSLMKSFYSHWLMDGMTKYDALEAAKKDVRLTTGWEHPQYWAPFILIDALD